MQQMQDYCVEMKELSFFRPSEEVDSVTVRELSQSIVALKKWTTPIPVERGSGIVMDGNHRVNVARQLGLTHLPCILLEYNDPRVTVWKSGADEPYAIENIFRTVMSNQLLGYKSTRHLFSPLLPKVDIPLQCLTTVSTDGIARQLVGSF